MIELLIELVLAIVYMGLFAGAFWLSVWIVPYAQMIHTKSKNRLKEEIINEIRKEKG